ncbi:hypothetical protein DGWBC_1728 [Dehalogenimonas sp. WBC-2]|nr:hypothetical protein DGWBC_1728 [Dehalogenimonas sp. WBC-2]
MIRVTTLIDNEPGDGLHSEWGLSFLVEAYGQRFIFDTGASGKTVDNAKKLGVDLKNIDGIFLSHGHVDHTGGLLDLLAATSTVNIYAQTGIWQKRYSSGGKRDPDENIGMPGSVQALEQKGACFHVSEASFFLGSNVYTTGVIPYRSEFEKPNATLLVQQGQDRVIDPFNDELALVIHSKPGLIIVVGCAHRGLINTIKQAQAISGVGHVYAVIGGSHLHDATPEIIEKTITELNRIGVQKLSLCHCTGAAALEMVNHSFKGECIFNHSGASIRLM